jgi:two-component SAPR family response regulator
VIILSRILPEGLLEDADLRSLSSFLPAETRQMLWDYGQGADQALLEVRAFGEGRVHLNGRSVENWDGALPRALFFYLVDRGMVTRAEIFQTFWPNLSTREATNVFHVTKRKVSEVLGTELTVYGSSFYHISPQIQLSYDVSLFNQLVQDSDSGDRNGDLLREALALYRGDYLMSIKSPWVANRRDSLQQAACDALVGLGRICENEGNIREALGYYVRASHLRTEREDAAYAAMRLYRDLNMPQDALATYQRLVKTLRERLNVAPSSQIHQLAVLLGA